MNRSIFGPVVFNSAAPDDGNMMILDKVLPEAMKAEWLQPIVNGDVQSAFAMTEPDGCGSDPNLTNTKAERVGRNFHRISPGTVETCRTWRLALDRKLAISKAITRCGRLPTWRRGTGAWSGKTSVNSSCSYWRSTGGRPVATE